MSCYVYFPSEGPRLVLNDENGELPFPIDQGWEHLEDCAARGVQNRQALYDLHNSPSFDERLAKAVEQKTLQLKDRPGLGNGKLPSDLVDLTESSRRNDYRNLGI